MYTIFIVELKLSIESVLTVYYKYLLFSKKKKT